MPGVEEARALTGGQATVSMPMLEVTGLGKSYGSTRALDGVSFRVEQGEMFGLLGPNGAGKTTLLSIVCGLLSPTSGDVKLQGHSVLAGGGGTRGRAVLVPQEMARCDR